MHPIGPLHHHLPDAVKGAVAAGRHDHDGVVVGRAEVSVVMSTGPRDRSFMVGSVGAKNAGGGRVSEITTAEPIDWRDQIFVVLKAAGIRQVG